MELHANCARFLSPTSPTGCTDARAEPAGHGPRSSILSLWNRLVPEKASSQVKTSRVFGARLLRPVKFPSGALLVTLRVFHFRLALNSFCSDSQLPGSVTRSVFEERRESGAARERSHRPRMSESAQLALPGGDTARKPAPGERHRLGRHGCLWAWGRYRFPGKPLSVQTISFLSASLSFAKAPAWMLETLILSETPGRCSR